MVQQNVDSGYLENDEVDEMIMQRIEERTLYGLEFQLVNNHDLSRACSLNTFSIII